MEWLASHWRASVITLCILVVKWSSEPALLKVSLLRCTDEDKLQWPKAMFPLIHDKLEAGTTLRVGHPGQGRDVSVNLQRI